MAMTSFVADRLKDLNPDYEVDDDNNYAFWAGSVIGPIVCILAVVHALLWGFPSAIVGSIVSYTVNILSDAAKQWNSIDRARALQKRGGCFDQCVWSPQLHYMTITCLDIQKIRRT